MIDFPQTAAFGKKIPLVQLKNQGLPSRLLAQIKSLVWAYKLSPSTVQLAATEAVKEIEVMDLTVKPACASVRALAAVISALDKLIPNPLIFRVYDEDGSPREVAFNLKASGGALFGDSEVYRLFRTEDDVALPTGVGSLESFYQQLAAGVGGITAIPTESIRELAERHYRNESLRADLAEVARKLERESQFARKYELAKEKQRLQRELADV